MQKTKTNTHTHMHTHARTNTPIHMYKYMQLVGRLAHFGKHRDVLLSIARDIVRKSKASAVEQLGGFLFLGSSTLNTEPLKPNS